MYVTTIRRGYPFTMKFKTIDDGYEGHNAFFCLEGLRDFFRIPSPAPEKIRFVGYAFSPYELPDAEVAQVEIASMDGVYGVYVRKQSKGWYYAACTPSIITWIEAHDIRYLTLEYDV